MYYTASREPVVFGQPLTASRQYLNTFLHYLWVKPWQKSVEHTNSIFSWLWKRGWPLFSLPLPVESKQTPTPGWNDEQTPLRTGELHKQQQLSLPIRFALSHSFCVTSKHVLLHKETQDFTNIHAPSIFPIYRYYWVGVMFFILGLGTLLPWNFFMTASLVKTRPHKIWHNMKHMLGFQW